MKIEEIIKREKEIRNEFGDFGISECKIAILRELRFKQENDESFDLFDLLRTFARRAEDDIFFNRAMVLACWELINGKNLIVEQKKDMWGGAVNYEVKNIWDDSVLFESYCKKDVENYLKGGKK